MKKKPVNQETKSFAFLSEISLKENSTESTIEVLREGVIRDRDLRITRDMLNDYVAHYMQGVYGSDLQVNLGHFREGEAAGWFKAMSVQIDELGVGHLMATIDWTELGVDKITKKLYKYVSAEFAFEYPHAQTGEYIPNVFMGAGLTNIPAMKNQKALALSEIMAFNSQDQSIAMFKSLLENMKGRKSLSAEDVAFLRAQLSEQSAEEQEAHKAEVDEVEKKQKEQAEAEAKASEEAKKAEEAKLNEAKKGTVSLAEHLALKEQVERQTLSETVDKTLTLSASCEIGFRDESKNEVVDFMLSLTPGQRTKFTALMGKVAAVKFGAIGSDKSTKTGSMENLSEDQKQAKVVELSEKLMKEQKLDIRDAQRQAYKEVFGVQSN